MQYILHWTKYSEFSFFVRVIFVDLGRGFGEVSRAAVYWSCMSTMHVEETMIQHRYLGIVPILHL